MLSVARVPSAASEHPVPRSAPDLRELTAAGLRAFFFGLVACPPASRSSCSARRDGPPSSSGRPHRNPPGSRVTRSNACRSFSASTRRCRFCCPNRTPPTPGSNAPTPRRRSANARRWTACWRAILAIRGPPISRDISRRDARRLGVTGPKVITSLARTLAAQRRGLVACLSRDSHALPAVNLFDRVASSPQDFEALYALEAMTNAACAPKSANWISCRPTNAASVRAAVRSWPRSRI